MSVDRMVKLGLNMPGRVEELGIPKGLLEDLLVRRMLVSRSASIMSISHNLAVSAAIVRELADELRDRKELEYLGVEGRDYRIGLTAVGEANARERAKVCSYSDAAPVPLREYVRVIEAQKAKLIVNRENIRSAFGDLVVADELLDKIGPAFMSDGAIFLYGPPGTGKTSLAERMIKIHKDLVFVPRAVEVDSQVVIVHDPAVHVAAPEQPEGLDPRWVLCERPLVMVGGELNHDMMDLQYDSVSGIYSAPIQMKANNGLLVVDDFGRQQITPTEVLNRWIVPLSREIDFLRLVSGVRFTIPFELKLVASTNLDPAELGDDAFLRRLRNKVLVGPISDNAFNWILVRVAKAKGIEVGGDDAAHLRVVARRNLGELRPYVAVDFCELMLGVCAYEGIPRRLDRTMIDRVAAVYFLNEGDDPAIAVQDSGSERPLPAAVAGSIPPTPPVHTVADSAPAVSPASDSPVPPARPAAPSAAPPAVAANPDRPPAERRAHAEPEARSTGGWTPVSAPSGSDAAPPAASV